MKQEELLPNQIHLNMTKIRITLKALTTGTMPFYSASIFRGMWGREIRKVTCIDEKLECIDCSYMRNCAYGAIFEPTSSVFAPDLKAKLHKLPPPFIVDVPLFFEQKWNEGETKEITLTLFGETVKYVYHFVETLLVIGNQFGVGPDRIRYSVEDIHQIRRNSHIHNVTLDELMDDNLFSEPWEWKQKNNSPTSLLIEIGSPIRIQKKGRVLESMDMISFFLSIFRRVHYLAHLYGKSFDFPKTDQLVNMIQSSVHITKDQTKWDDWHRFSSKQKKVMNFGGIVGTFQLQGDLKPLLPFLLAGSEVHTGKQTVFGLGKYKIWQECD